MAIFPYNDKKIVAPSRVELEQELSERMIGFETATGSIGAKKLAGDMTWFTPEGGDAFYNSAKLEALSGFGTSNIGVDNAGNIILRDAVGVVQWIDFEPQDPAPDYLEGRLWYSETEHTYQFHSDNQHLLNYVNGTTTVRVRNETGETIPINTCVDIHGGSLDGLGLRIHVADAYVDANQSDEGWAVAVTTEDVLNLEYVTCIFEGTLVDVDTSGLTVGRPAYLGTTGAITNVRPNYPAQSVLIGTAIVSDAINGVLAVKVTFDNFDYEFDGTVLEQQEYNIVVDGTSVFLDVWNKAIPSRALPVQLSGDILQLNTLTGAGVGGKARVELVQGTTLLSQKQIIYVENVAGVATLKTTVGYPPEPHAQVAEIAIQTYTDVADHGAIVDRRNTTSKALDGRGMISYLTERWGREPVRYDAGITPTVTIDDVPTPDQVTFSSLSGFVYQKLRQSFPAFNIETDGIYVLNASGNGVLTANQVITNLIEANEDSDGNILTNNRLHLTIVGLINHDEATCKVGVLLPSGSYGNNDAAAYKDYNNTAVTNVSATITDVAFLIAIVPLKIFGAGNDAEFINGVGQSEIKNVLGSTLGINGSGAGSSTAFIPTLAQVLTEGNIAGEQIKTVTAGTDIADVMTMDDMNIDNFATPDRVFSYIEAGIRQLSLFGDGKLASRVAEIETLDTNSLTGVNGMINELDSDNIRAGSPVNTDAIINIGAGAVLAESYTVSSTLNADLDGSYILDSATGALFPAEPQYVTYFIDGTNKRLRPIASFNGGPAYKYAIVEEVSPTQFSTLNQDGSNAYYQAVQDPDNIANGSYTGGGIYAGDQSGVAYVPPQSGESLHAEGDAVIEGVLGVGTIAPLNLAEFKGTVPQIDISDSDSLAIASTALLNFNGTDSRAGVVGISSGDMYLSTETDSDIILQTDSVEVMRIGSDGNVGIDNNDPLAPLHIGTGYDANGIQLQSVYPTDVGLTGINRAISWSDVAQITGQIDTRYNGTSVEMHFGHLFNSVAQTDSIMVIDGTGEIRTDTTSEYHSVKNGVLVDINNDNNPAGTGLSFQVRGEGGTKSVFQAKVSGLVTADGLTNDQISGESTTSKVLITKDYVENGKTAWVEIGATGVYYSKDILGRVTLKGEYNTDASGLLGVLPADFRTPESILTVAIQPQSSIIFDSAKLNVYSNGNVIFIPSYTSAVISYNFGSVSFLTY